MSTESDLKAAIHSFRERGKKALLREGEDQLNISRNEFVPIDKGDLRDDSGVELVDNGGSDSGPIEVVLWYGKGKAKAYALPVHEHPSKYDPPSWVKSVHVHFNHGGPKYLEGVMRGRVQGLDRRIAQYMREG